MALLQGNQGQIGKQTGQNLTAGFGESSDLLVTELQARYYQQAYRGNTFFTSVSSAAGTAYTGASGGTPLVAIYNPVGSGVNAVLKTASVAVAATATATGHTTFRIYAGVTVLPTGTFVVPFSANTWLQSGSKVKAVNNAAMTSASALNYVTTVGTFDWVLPGTAASVAEVIASPLIWDAAGQLIVPPGVALALGSTTIPTSMTNDASLFWDEVAI
jgi:hypothetical protein